MRSTPRLALLTLALLVSPLPAQLGLSGLAALARERAARQRPALVAALKPYFADLGLEYRANRTYLEPRFDEISETLGPVMVPLLLEHLAPNDSSPESSHRSENAARILSRLGPATFTDTLLDLMSGTNEIGRRNALWLAGYTGQDRVATAILGRLDQMSEPEQFRAITSLDQLETTRGIPAVAKMLLSDSHRLRMATLLFLNRADTDGSARATVTAAFENEKSDQLIGLYVDYLATHANADQRVAETLLPLVTSARLTIEARENLVRGLGHIAPKGHAPTKTLLAELVDKGHVGRIEMNAALALRDLGDDDALKTISKRHSREVKSRRNDPDVYAGRAGWYVDLEEWRDAIRDYEWAIKHSRNGSSRARYHLLVARCQAHRGSAAKVRTALKNSGVGRRTIEREAASDPVFEKILADDKIQKFLESIE